MSDFVAGDIWDLCSYDPDICGLADKFGWWSLGHNFDVVACILAMAHLSWEKGFDAGRAIKSLTDAHEDIENNRHALYPDVFNR